MVKIKRFLKMHFFDRASVQAVRNGLILILPVMLAGSFSTLLQSFPVPAYKVFLQEFAGGVLGTLLQWINHGTFGILSLYMVVSISYCYIRELEKDSGHWIEAIAASLASYAILSGILLEGFDMGRLGASGMFTAIVSAVLGTKLYNLFVQRFSIKTRLYADGADSDFLNAWTGLIPFLSVIVVMLLIHAFIVYICKVNSLQDIFKAVCGAMFHKLGSGNDFGSGLLFVALSTFLWFFGIHGNNALYDVIIEIMMPATKANILAVEAGEVPTQILTNNFFDFFVDLGGCGASLCLVLAILIFSKRKGNRRLAATALPAVLFNISELVVFGIPVVFNPILFIPFLLTPIVLYCISYFAFAAGLVPVICSYTSWAMPGFVNGYIATGSAAGILLQVVNICVGVAIYYPFIKRLDRQRQLQAVGDLDDLVHTLKESEMYYKPVTLIYLPGTAGILAKTLVNDLQQALRKKEIEMYYQPQFDSNGYCIGAEALLRWKHPVFGMMYPPLVIKLAEETKLLFDLEKYVFTTVAESVNTIRKELGEGCKVSVNVSGSTLIASEFREFLKDLVERYKIEPGSICIEVNEQTALLIDDDTVDLLTCFKKLGFLNAIDDFSMGHTSLKCLRTGQFDVVKLDGELVRDIFASQKNQKIIESIMHLSKTMGFEVLAEFVETQEQQVELEGIGCTKYQGYLFGAALPLNDFIQRAKESKECKKESAITEE